MLFRTASLVACLLVGCGRVGFDPLGGDGGSGSGADAAPGLLTVVVTGDTANAGMPIADAVVAFVEDAGPTSFETTDSAGVATHLVGGATTVHVAWVIGTAASVYTVADVGGGMTLRIGSASVKPVDMMTFSFPLRANATEYFVSGPSSCQINATSTSMTVPTDFATDCAGPQRVVAQARTTAGTLGWIDLDPVTLAAGTISNQGAWQPPVTRTVQVDSDPTVSEIGAAFSLADGTELGQHADMAPGGSATLTVDAADITPEAVFVQCAAPLGGNLVWIPMPAPTGTLVVTPADFNAAIATVDLDTSTSTVSWTMASIGVTPILNVVQGQFDVPTPAVTVNWTAYVPTSARSVAFPDLPELLPFATPSPTWGSIGVAAVRIGDLDYRDSLRGVYATAVPDLGNVRIGQSMRILNLTAMAAPPRPTFTALRWLR